MDPAKVRAGRSSLNIELDSRSQFRDYSDGSYLLQSSQKSLASIQATENFPRKADGPHVFFPQNPSLVSLWRRAQNQENWAWLPEFVCCLVAIAALIAILYVLFWYQNKALPDLPHGITINTLISVLVTIMKGAIAVPLAEGLSQLKWAWFKKDRPLHDMTTFDSASRSTLGASQLVILLRGWHLASLGSLLLIAILAIGPFSQQVIQVKLRSVTTDDAASIPICGSPLYQDWGRGAGPGLNLVPLSTIGAIYEGLFQTNPNSTVSASCPSGNCTFNTYQTLGFCSQCANLTDQIITTFENGTRSSDEEECGVECEYHLSNGLMLAVGETTMNATTSNSLLALSQRASFVNFTAIMGPGSSFAGGVQAVECAMYFCIHTYDAAVNAGSFNEIPQYTSTRTSDFTPLEPSLNITFTPDVCHLNGTKILPPYNTTKSKQNCTYTADFMSHLALGNTLSPLLTGSGSRSSWSSNTIEALYGTYGSVQDVNSTFAALTTALNTHARTTVCHNSIPGSAWTTQSYIRVRWPWMILPVALVGLSVAFFLTTVLKTRGQHVWKSSPLALLFCGLSDSARRTAVIAAAAGGGGERGGEIAPVLSKMEDAARALKVRLDERGDYRLVSES